MKPENDIKRFYEKAVITTNTKKDAEVFGRVLASGQKNTLEINIHIWRIIMNSKITKIAAAVVIIIGVLFFLNHNGSTSVVWGHVGELTADASSVIMHVKRSETFLKGDGEQLNQTVTSDETAYLSTKYGSRTDTFTNNELVQQNYEIIGQDVDYVISHKQKSYMLFKHSQRDPNKESEKYDIKKWVNDILSKDYKKLGSSNIDGIKVEGIEVQESDIGKGFFRLWVDVKTNLPVRIDIEMEQLIPEIHQHIITKGCIDKFQWNVNLEASIFEPNIPADYKLIEPNITNPNTEKTSKATKAVTK
jgi:hypothetical protein